MYLTKVIDYLRPLGLADRVMALKQSSATVEEAAIAIGCPPERIAKTLSFRADGVAHLVVTAGDQRVDNGKYKECFHQKAVMLPAAEVEALVGYPVGGVCPFALPVHVPVYLDESLKRFQEVYPAAGTGASAVRLTLAELQLASGARGWVDVCKPR